jgi:hypothetical protein
MPERRFPSVPAGAFLLRDDENSPSQTDLHVGLQEGLLPWPDKPFGELTKGFTPARRARVAAKAGALREAMTLEELRKARSLSQE